LPKAELMVYSPTLESEKKANKAWFPKMKEAKKKIKTELKVAIKKFKKDRRTNRAKGFSVGIQILLIILSVFVAFIAFTVVALLGCSVACSGSEGLGTAIILLGIAGIGVGLFFVIRNIIRNGENYKGKKKAANELRV